MLTRSTLLTGAFALCTFLSWSGVQAKSAFGEACSQENNRYDQNTWAFVSDCDAQFYCADNSTCAHKGCRRDIFPYGYNYVPFDKLPPMCPEGEFCPDEGDRCLPVAAKGEGCQKDRDDECAHPPNWRDLSGYLNTNGSICLNYTCTYADATLGQTCQVDNTRYTGYTLEGAQYAYIVSRDNCANGLYCDGTALQCLRVKPMGAACEGNKECASYNCPSSKKCGRNAEEPIHPPVYSFVLIGLGIIIMIVGVFVTLWFVHRKQRTENQRRLEQYWNEQVAYRQSIMSMSNAKKSLLGQGAQDDDSIRPPLPPLPRGDTRDSDIFSDAATPPREHSPYPPSPYHDQDPYNAPVNAPMAPSHGYNGGAAPGPSRRESEAVWSEGDSEVLLLEREKERRETEKEWRQG